MPESDTWSWTEDRILAGFSEVPSVESLFYENALNKFK